LQDENGQTFYTNSWNYSAWVTCSYDPNDKVANPIRAQYHPITDSEAMEAFSILSNTEGIIPAIETAHAIAGTIKLGKELGKDATIIINCSGRGDKDVETAAKWFKIN